MSLYLSKSTRLRELESILRSGKENHFLNCYVSQCWNEWINYCFENPSSCYHNEAKEFLRLTKENHNV